jgi:hypothetical protein
MASLRRVIPSLSCRHIGFAAFGTRGSLGARKPEPDLLGRLYSARDPGPSSSLITANGRRFACVARPTTSTPRDGHRASQRVIGGRIAALLRRSGSVAMRIDALRSRDALVI